MKEVLAKCVKEDFEYLSEVLDSYLSFTDDKKRKELLSNMDYAYTKEALITLIDEQIRYYGSSDIGYFKRMLLGDDGGISAEELISDVCEKLKVKIKVGGSVEAKLERLVNAVVEKELFSKSPSDLAKSFKDIGVGNADVDLIMDGLKNSGKAAILPVLLKVVGPKFTLGIIQSIIISIIGQIIGKTAAKKILTEIAKKNPWLNALGPVVWILSTAWVAFDLQGPAFRKTVPIALYLGVVALRDGEEDKK